MERTVAIGHSYAIMQVSLSSEDMGASLCPCQTQLNNRDVINIYPVVLCELLPSS